jgi:hypothetical protein
VSIAEQPLWPFAPSKLSTTMSDQTVNAGENLQRLAGEKVQQGCKQEGPRSGAFLLVAFHF